MIMLTSSLASRVESNWVKICSSGLRQTLAITFSRPLCGIPMLILSTPNSLDLSMIIFNAGISTSHPSIPNRFSEDHFFARKASNLLKIWSLTLHLPRVINFNFLLQSLTRDISYSMENLAIDSLLRWKLTEQSFLTTSLNHFLLEWLGEFALWAWIESSKKNMETSLYHCLNATISTDYIKFEYSIMEKGKSWGYGRISRPATIHFPWHKTYLNTVVTIWYMIRYVT